MKKLVTLSLVLIITLTTALPVFAKNNSYIYRNRANWVKLIKLSNKQLAGQTLNHPYTSLTTQQMVAMLSSLEMNKSKLFGKEKVKEVHVFTPEEARKYAPLIIKALEQAAPNQLVNLSIVHKRPFYVLRNDFLSMINIYATGEGVHFNFSKLFARLKGDYQQASQIDESISKAKSIRVSLKASEGQVLSPDTDEIILNPGFDFSTRLALNTGDNSQPQEGHEDHAEILQPETAHAPADDVKTKLSKLEELKKAALISNAEYKKKRKEILETL